jgi:hypothetical protein
LASIEAASWRRSIPVLLFPGRPLAVCGMLRPNRIAMTRHAKQGRAAVVSPAASGQGAFTAAEAAPDIE